MRTFGDAVLFPALVWDVVLPVDALGAYKGEDGGPRLLPHVVLLHAVELYALVGRQGLVEGYEVHVERFLGGSRVVLPVVVPVHGAGAYDYACYECVCGIDAVPGLEVEGYGLVQG